MARQSNQLVLPIEPPENLLHEAHQRIRLQKSFEDAMQLQHFRICLRHLAMNMINKGRESK